MAAVNWVKHGVGVIPFSCAQVVHSIICVVNH